MKVKDDKRRHIDGVSLSVRELLGVLKQWLCVENHRRIRFIVLSTLRQNVDRLKEVDSGLLRKGFS